MSIDPPQRLAPQGAFNFASVHLAVDGVRDASIPPSPLSPRPSFRMRSSLTPQPTLPPSRHFSEPPPLNQLVSNPMFLHPPQAPHQPAVRTLGTLVENARSVRCSTYTQAFRSFRRPARQAVSRTRLSCSPRPKQNKKTVSACTSHPCAV